MENKTLFIGLSVIIGIIILLYFTLKRFKKSQILADMLKEKDDKGILKYSQGRVYLCISLLLYYAALGVVLSKALKPNSEMDTNTLDTIVNNLQWVIAVMASYVFGGKGLEVLKAFFAKKNEKNNGNDSNGGQVLNG